MVEAVNLDSLVHEFRVLHGAFMLALLGSTRVGGISHSPGNHLKNLALHEFKILSVACRGAADHIVDPRVVIFSGETA